MWVIPSHGRPGWLKRLADSFGPLDLKEPVTVILCEKDAKVREYLRIKWPDSWNIWVASGETTYCAEKLNFAFNRMPNERFYGHLCDDVWLLTQDMLPQLSEAAGDWKVSYPSDGIYDDQPEGIICFPCMGGKLVRAIGWWAHPALKHNCIDSVWTDIARTLGLVVDMRHLKLGMTHPANRAAEWDDTYRRVEAINLEAGGIYHAVWDGKPERTKILNRIKESMVLNGL
jgi:hypothetical protein